MPALERVNVERSTHILKGNRLGLWVQALQIVPGAVALEKTVDDGKVEQNESG